MVILILSWAVLFLVFIAFGDILILIWNRLTKKDGKYSIVDQFWIGLSMLGGVSILLSIFIPINIYALVLVLLLSFIYWVSNLRKLRSLFNNMIASFKQMYWASKVLVCLSVVLILILGLLSPGVLGDHELYHFQTMKWIQNYSVVPGLGNLHGRLTFNSSFFLITTLFSFHPDHFPLFYPINSLCFLVFSVWLFSRIKKDSSFWLVLGIAGIYISLVYVFRLILSSSSNDVLPNILVAYILVSAILESDKKSLLSRLLPLVVVSTFCITLKLSSIFIILIPLYVLFLLAKQKEYRIVICSVVLMAIIVLPWIARFIVLSGYLIYPFPAIDIFAFDWKIPLSEVQLEKNWVTSWARIPTVDQKVVLAMPFAEWFPEWASKQGIFVLLLHLLAICSPVYLLFLRGKSNVISVFIWLVAFIGFVYCFSLAPAIRFYIGFLAVTPFLPLLVFKGLNVRLLKIAIMLFASFYMVKSGCFEFKRMMLFSYQNPFIYPTFYGLKNCEDLNNETHAFENSDVVIYLYKDGDVQGQNACFPSALGCSPYLEMRTNDLKDGFRISKKDSK